MYFRKGVGSMSDLVVNDKLVDGSNQYGLQGDVIFIRIESLPASAKKITDPNDFKKALVLAEGEVTGHFHKIQNEDALNIDEDDTVGLYTFEDGKLVIVNDEAISVTHQEHDTVAVPPGMWEVRIAKEYDHFLEEAREVRD
jgi:hypothetical protein